MKTIADVGPKIVKGVAVELDAAEKQAIVDEWNANISSQEERLRNIKTKEARQNAIDRALDAIIASDATYQGELTAIAAMDISTLRQYKPK